MEKFFKNRIVFFFPKGLFSLLVLCSSTLLTPCFGQINASKGISTFSYYSPKDFPGLNQIWAVDQHPDGYMIFGSNTGVIKYDGENWENLISPINGFNTSCRAFLSSTDGTFYYGCLGDIGYLDQDSLGNLIEVSLSHLIPESNRLFNDTWTIHESDGKIYFQSREYIYVYTRAGDKKEGTIEVWKPDSEFMFAFHLDRNYYVHQQDLGLFKRIGGKLELIPGSEFLGKDRVQLMLPFRKPGNYLLAMFTNGLVEFDGTRFRPFKTEIDSVLSQTEIYKGLVLPDQTIALASIGSGVEIIDSLGRRVRNFGSEISNFNDSPYSLFLDNSGSLWVGTDTGVYKIEISSPLTRFFARNINLTNILSLNALDDDLYIGTAQEVAFLSKETGEIKPFPGISKSQIFQISRDSDQLLVGADGLYGIKNRMSSKFMGSTSGDFQILQILVSKAHPGYVFVSGSFGIKILKRPTNPTYSQDWKYLGELPQMQRDIYQLVEDTDGNLWAGTQAGELFKIEWEQSPAKDLIPEKTAIHSFSRGKNLPGPAGSVTRVGDKIYLASNVGYFYYEPASDQFKKDTLLSFSNKILDLNFDSFSILPDALGRLILNFAGERKLAIPQSGGRFVLQDYPLNLFTGETITSFFSEPNGVLWLGTDEGLIRIDGDKPNDTDRAFQLYFTRVIGNGDTLSHKTQDELSLVPEIQFKNNTIRFGYAAPFFIQETKTQYQTFLEGFDQDWGSWETNGWREFSNLPSGDYIFRVRSKNIYNTISNEITYRFTVLPPWYAAWWAYLIYFILFGLLIWMIYRYQKKRIQAMENQKAKERELSHAREIEKAYTELANAHENLKATQEQLVQQEKLASLGQLTAGIAHEIKNPLNFVNNFSELSSDYIQEIEDELEKTVDSPEKETIKELLDDVKSNLSKIRHHGLRADGIVKSMLQHSRGGTGAMEPTDLNALIREYSNLAFHGMRANPHPINVEVKLILQENLPLVKLNTEDFSRVILNLTKNAFDAMRDKISSVGSEYKAKLELRSQVSGSRILFEVEDNGPGVPEEIRDKLLMPFFTTKKGTEGTGLGLSITHDIVNAHEGELIIESEVGKYTRFKILLPKSTT